MNVFVSLVLLTAGDPETVVDRVLPELVVVQIRVLTLRKGMSDHEVHRRLGLKSQTLIFSGSTIANSCARYQIGSTHVLTLNYSLKEGERLKHGLTEATLTKISPR